MKELTMERGSTNEPATEQTEEEDEREDFEFLVFSQRGGWPQRNEQGDYKKRTTQLQWLEWLKSKPLP